MHRDPTLLYFTVGKLKRLVYSAGRRAQHEDKLVASGFQVEWRETRT